MSCVHVILTNQSRAVVHIFTTVIWGVIVKVEKFITTLFVIVFKSQWHFSILFVCIIVYNWTASLKEVLTWKILRVMNSIGLFLLSANSSILYIDLYIDNSVFDLDFDIFQYYIYSVLALKRSQSRARDVCVLLFIVPTK